MARKIIIYNIGFAIMDLIAFAIIQPSLLNVWMVVLAFWLVAFILILNYIYYILKKRFFKLDSDSFVKNSLKFSLGIHAILVVCILIDTSS